ncbi:MAG: Rieske (2Fe-2S) protein, partial [Comamonas sp.]
MPVLSTATLPDTALIAAGEARELVFAPGGESILLLNGEGEFYALENSCPHAGASMASGSCEAHVLRCPAHGLQFNIKNGQCTASPGLLIPMYEPLILDG